MKQKKLYRIITYLSLVGILLSVYLLWQQFFTPSIKPCNINATINCDAIITGEVAKTLGVPTPLYGFIGYIVILVAALSWQKKLLLGMASFGLLFCLWIGYRELFELRVICPVCILCQTVMTAIFILAIKIFKLPADAAPA